VQQYINEHELEIGKGKTNTIKRYGHKAFSEYLAITGVELQM
jgi:hypothetical protein